MQHHPDQHLAAACDHATKVCAQSLICKLVEICPVTYPTPLTGNQVLIVLLATAECIHVALPAHRAMCLGAQPGAGPRRRAGCLTADSRRLRRLWAQNCNTRIIGRQPTVMLTHAAYNQIGSAQAAVICLPQHTTPCLSLRRRHSNVVVGAAVQPRLLRYFNRASNCRKG